MQAEARSCQNCKIDFQIDEQDFDFYEKMKVPAPTWCPECRMIRRMSFWNERNFFKKLEKRTGKEIFSMYPPDAPIEIYDRDYWWGDDWDPKSYGRDIDWNRSFWDQIRELQLAVPFAARAVQRTVNSDYSNNAADVKNCYMCFNADASEDCLYGININANRNCIDFMAASYNELSYDFHTSGNCYQCFFVSNCGDCRNMWLSDDCNDCSDCFGCVNLRHKKYCIFNKQYTKEGYFKKLEEMNLGSHKSLMEWKKKFEEFKLKFPRKHIHGLQNQNVVGDYIYNSKNTLQSFNVLDCENVKYSQNISMGLKDSYDYTNWGNNSELMYETIACGEFSQRLKFCWECWPGCQDMEYSMACRSSKNLFGCVGLKKSEYCILNKEYSKEEYEELVPRIKKHMDEMPFTDKVGRVYKYGEFFPSEWSWVAVNESAVIDFMRMNKDKAISYGLEWREVNPKEYKTTMQAHDIADDVKDADESICKQIIRCEICERGYQIVKAEFDFLKRFSIPLPRRCFNCRFQNRLEQRNLPVFYSRLCQCAGISSGNAVYKNEVEHFHGEEACKNEFVTAYSSVKPEIVYCEQCYTTEVAS